MKWLKKTTTSKVIITCHSALVPYYLSKGFIIVVKVERVFVNTPKPVLQKTNASPLHEEDRLMAFK